MVKIMNSLSPSLLEMTFRYVSDAIVILDTDGFIIAANPSVERLTGYCSEELTEKVKLCELCLGMEICPKKAVCENCFKTIGSVRSLEMELKRKDGQAISVAVSLSRLPKEADGILIVVLRDMSELYLREKERFRQMMTNYIITAQEEERKRVSRELHDGLGQSLYSILVGLQVIEKLDLPDNVAAHFKQLKEMSLLALEEVQTMAVEMRPSSLDDWGLGPALRNFAKRFEQTYGIIVNLYISGPERRYLPAMETALYRICQEAMTNAAKYADTESINIYLSEKNETVCLAITDFGKGFDVEHVQVKGSGLGLYGMQERARLIGGDLEIASRIGQGTDVRVYVTVNEKGEPNRHDTNYYC